MFHKDGKRVIGVRCRRKKEMRFIGSVDLLIYPSRKTIRVGGRHSSYDQPRLMRLDSRWTGMVGTSNRSLGAKSRLPAAICMH